MGSLGRSLKRKIERDNRKNDMKVVWDKLQSSTEHVYRNNAVDAELGRWRAGETTVETLRQKLKDTVNIDVQVH